MSISVSQEYNHSVYFVSFVKHPDVKYKRKYTPLLVSTVLLAWPLSEERNYGSVQSTQRGDDIE